MHYKTVIFDLDGTLVNSIDGIALSMNSVLERHGFPTHSTKKYMSLVGNGFRELVRKSLPVDILDTVSISPFLDEMREAYAKNWHYNMTVYAGIEDLLDFLHKNGIMYAVNTNKDELFSKNIITKFFTKCNFSCIVGGNSSKPLKPDPAGALFIAQTTGVLPKDCLYVGDSEIDIITAKNAQMYPVSVVWGFREESDLVKAGAMCTIKKPLDLIHILRS